MLNVTSAEWLTSLILLIVAYFISITINGVLQAWTAARLGDPTAEEMGFTSFNPLDHFELISFIALIIFHLGWPRSIPINPLNVDGPHRLARLFAIYSVETVVSLFLAFAALALSVGLFGVTTTYGLASLMFVEESAPLRAATSALPHYSSLAIIVALFLIAVVFLNIFIAALSLIINGFKYALVLGFERGYKYIVYADYITLFGPMVVILLFANPLRYYLLKIIMWSACKMALLLGVFHL